MSPLFAGADVTVMEGAPQVEVSASAIRADLKQGRSVRALLAPAVLDYIERSGLYADKK